jgi:ABC-type bacteriocin/lantibiotic exporter with double-glycine peptidase domain
MEFNEVSVSQYLFKHKGKILILTFLSILKALIGFVVPFITREIFKVGETGNLPEPGTFIYFLAAIVGLFLIDLVNSNFSLNFALSFKTRESHFLFRKMMEMDLDFINKKGPTYYTSRIVDSLEHIYNLVGSFGANFIVATFTILASLFFIFTINKVLFSLFVVMLPLSYFSYKKLNYKLLQKTKQMQHVSAGSRQNIINISQNIFAFKQMFNYSKIAGRLKELVHQLNQMNKQVSWYAQVLSLTIIFMINIIKNAIIFLTAYYFLHNKMLISDMIFINLVMSIYFTALTNLNSININKRDMKAAIDFINVDILGHCEPDHGIQQLGTIEKIEIKIDAFAYNGNDKVLKDICLNIKKGEKIAFVGAAGCGKSTLLKLLGRFYQCNGIRINNRDISDYTLKSFRENVFYSPQDTYILPGTILENIVVGLPHVEKARLERVLSQPFLVNFLQELPKGLNTVIGENGLNLSGGQKQKILVARILMRQPELLILDESTASLDSHCEKQIYRSLEDFFPNATIIKVAHRHSTVIDCDSIFVMKAGRLVGQGTHLELIDSCNEYKQAFENQMELDLN